LVTILAERRHCGPAKLGHPPLPKASPSMEKSFTLMQDRMLDTTVASYSMPILTVVGVSLLLVLITGLSLARNSKNTQKRNATSTEPVASTSPQKKALPENPYLRHFSTLVLPEGEPRCGVVWLPGLGDNEERWPKIIQEAFRVSAQLGPCKFMIVRPLVHRVACINQMTTSWFNMQTLPLENDNLAPRHGCGIEDAFYSCNRVHAAIDRMIAEGIPAENIVLGGASQGGSMALFAAVCCRLRLAGVIMFDSVLFFDDLLSSFSYSWPQHRGLPIMWGHSRDVEDAIIHPCLHDAGVKVLKEHGFTVISKKYDDNDADIRMKDASIFCAALLAPTPAPREDLDLPKDPAAAGAGTS